MERDEEKLLELEVLKEFDFHSIWNRMQDVEKDIFWKNFQNLLKSYSLVSNCGPTLDLFYKKSKQMAADKVKPEDRMSNLIQEMFSGGDMSQQIKKQLSEKDSLEKMMNGFETLLSGNNSGDDDINKCLQNMKQITSFAKKKINNASEEDMKDMENIDFSKIMGSLGGALGGLGGGLGGGAGNALIPSNFDPKNFDPSKLSKKQRKALKKQLKNL